MAPELKIIAINASIILIAYFYVYPKYAGSNVNKLAINDIYASALSLFIAGSMFWGTGHEFNAIIFSANWFWYSIFIFLLIEIPLTIWYYKKNNVLDSIDS